MLTLTLVSPYVEIPSPGYSQEARLISNQLDRITDPSYSILLETLSSKFYNLVTDWKEEVKVKSSLSEITSHPSYLRIVGLGPQIIPLILRDLKREPDYWFAALAALTGENPVFQKDKGDLKAMTKTWIVWGEKHGYI